MALLFMDSFDHYVTADITEKWTQLGAGVADTSIIAAVGRRGSGGWKMTCTGSSSNNAPVQLLKVLGPADNTIVLGLAFNPVTPFADLDNGTNSEQFSPTSCCSLLAVRYLSVTQCWVKVTPSGTLAVYRGTTLLGTTSAALTQGSYTYVEILLTIHGTAGVVTIRFNGAPVLALTAQNTRNGTGDAWNEIRIGAPSVSSFGPIPEWDLDDLYVLDGSGVAPWNTFLGDCRVDARFPTAAGATTGWTPSAGANWAAVDDTAPNDDTDYTSAAAAGVTDTFTLQDAPVAGAAIYGVQHCLSAKKTDAGVGVVAPVIRHSGVDYVGADLSPGTAYAYLLQIAALNPGTAAAWTETGFNAAEFGYKRTA